MSRHWDIPGAAGFMDDTSSSTWKILLQGGIWSVCLLVLIYLVFQFVVPWVRYKLFKKKYVAKYVGKNMSLNDIQVSESCYYCKAPFLEGEEIVLKCEHAMHKSCWDENEYKCPEYGRNCKEAITITMKS